MPDVCLGLNFVGSFSENSVAISKNEVVLTMVKKTYTHTPYSHVFKRL